MNKNAGRGFVAAFAFLGLCLSSGTAGAVGSITGVISMDGGFDCACFAPGDTSIVSELMSLVQRDPATAIDGYGDYAGSEGPISPVETILLDPLEPGFPGVQPVYTFDDGTEFYAAEVWNIMRAPMVCTGGVCRDFLDFELIGRVVRTGFDDTFALLAWSGQGICNGRLGVCDDQPSASWSASLASPFQIPEPTSLALLGIGLFGIAALRRRVS